MDKPLTTRRKFLKTASTAAAIALGSKTGASATSNSKQTRARPRPAHPSRPNEKSKKLGPVVDKSEGSKFSLRRRLPSWHADTIAAEPPNEDAGDEYLFLEEAVQKFRANDGRERFKFFEPPKYISAFREPHPSWGTPKSWNDFNKWILGHEIKAPMVTKDDENSRDAIAFYRLLEQISLSIRGYNAALYWMRRLHFHENAPTGSEPMPVNPNGDLRLEPLPDLSTEEGRTEFNCWVREAEENWMLRVEELNGILADGTKVGGFFKYVSADFVEVNNYIVSMRIIANKQPFVRMSNRNGLAEALELGGSSSSHISISSAFSSPAPRFEAKAKIKRGR